MKKIYMRPICELYAMSNMAIMEQSRGIIGGGNGPGWGGYGIGDGDANTGIFGEDDYLNSYTSDRLWDE